MNFWEAKLNCEQEGATLVTIKTVDDLNAVKGGKSVPYV